MKPHGFLKRVCPTLMTGLLSFFAMLGGCDIEKELYIRVLFPPYSHPIFLISEAANFDSPAKIYSVEVFPQDKDVNRTLYWYIDVGYKGKGILSKRNPPVNISTIPYGLAPDGMETRVAARPLKPGVEYCIEVYSPLTPIVTECFTYQPQPF